MPDIKPHMPDAEAAVIGALVNDNGLINRVSAVLKPSDFFVERYRWIYEAMLALNSRGEPSFGITIYDEIMRLNDKRQFDMVLPDELAANAPTTLPENVLHLAGLIRDQGIKREIIDMAEDVARVGLSREQDKAGALARLFSDRVEGLMTQSVGAQPLSDVLVNVVSGAQQGSVKHVWTGIDPLDDLNRGPLMGGDVVYLAGTPGVGKTTFVYYMAKKMAAQGKNILIFTGEMLKEQVAVRFMGLRGVSSRLLRAGLVDDWDAVIDGAARSSFDNVFIEDKVTDVYAFHGAIESVQMRLRARDESLDLIIVDYLQFMSAGDITGEYDRVSAISRRLRALTTFYGVPIIAINNLRRIAGERPTMFDLRGSGQLEYDASVIVLMWRDAEDSHVLRFALDKNREGIMGEFSLNFDEDRAWLSDDVVAPGYISAAITASGAIQAYTFNTWETPTDWHQQTLTTARSILARAHTGMSAPVVLYGPSYTGKTHLANAILIEYIKTSGNKGYYLDWDRYTQALINTESDLEDKVLKASFRVVDDFERAVINRVDWHIAKLSAIVQDSLAFSKPLLIVTNQDQAGFYRLLRRSDKASSIISRLNQALWLPVDQVWQTEDLPQF